MKSVMFYPLKSSCYGVVHFVVDVLGNVSGPGPRSSLRGPPPRKGSYFEGYVVSLKGIFKVKLQCSCCNLRPFLKGFESYVLSLKGSFSLLCCVA